MDQLQRTMRKSFFKPAFMLFVASPLLAELLSSSSPATLFFQPAWLLLQLVSYGIPALIMREFSVRWKLGIKGMFVMALGYGVFNEGLAAGTFFKYNFSPSWIFYICVWHALHAILFPILITYFFYPEARSEPWIGNRWLNIFIGLSFLETILTVGGLKPFPWAFFIICWCVIVALAFIAKRLPGMIKESPTKKLRAPFLFGLFNLILYFVIYHYDLTVLPGSHVVPIFIMFVGVWYVLRKKQWCTVPAILAYASGSYVALAIFAMTRIFPVVILTSTVFIVFFVFFMRSLRRRYAVSAIVG